jgi:hypothetical protein
MDSPATAIAELFSKYETYSQQLDFRAIFKLYGRRILAADPRGTHFFRNNPISRWRFGKSMNEFYTKAGLISMRILGIKETPISDQFSLVKVNWAATFRKNPDRPIEFGISYIVRLARRRAEIVSFIAHDDETKILQGYGIIP